MKLSFARVILPIWALSACTLTRPNTALSPTVGFCEPSVPYAYNENFRPLPSVPADTALTNHFASHDILMANALGLLPLLQELSQLPDNNTTENRLERLSKLQQIQGRLSLASTEIASLAAELDCDGERADQLANYLDRKDQTRIRNLTLASVFIGAVTTVATALIQTDGLDKAVGIGGGLVSAGLGGTAAFSSRKSLPFTHKRNLLADIWGQSEQSSIYSPFIWYMLNEKLFSNTGQISIRHNIRQRWQEYAVAGASEQKKQLYFGVGGSYQADDFHNRADMLNQLQSSVRSINQDLQSLFTRITIVYH